MRPPFQSRFTDPPSAFTLLELLVAMGVLALLTALVSQLVNNAASITAMGNKRMDAEWQARAVFDRMAIDFARIVKRPDVDYFLKDGNANPQRGNDQIAFYSEVPGYYPETSSQRPVSLVAYRINSAPYRLERLGKGLLWNGASTSNPAVVFMPQTLVATWPTATNTTEDSNYEVIGPQVFRLEYFYILMGRKVFVSTSGTFISTGGTISMPSQPSVTPWSANITGHTLVNGLQDVTSVVVTIAVIDSKSRNLVSEDQLKNLASTMLDVSPANPGDLTAQWQSAIDSAINGKTIPQAAKSAIRVYSRSFPITPNFY